MSDTRHDPVLGSGATPVDGPLGRLVVVCGGRLTLAGAIGAQTAAEPLGGQFARHAATVSTRADGPGAATALPTRSVDELGSGDSGIT